ncbi:nucleotide 5'-monophosphate nucleosidase PpnN [Sulfuriflexus mobilis]|uniref:nucleotide 5'-monophosphate nucleosidase PpnN n=1 Tax=Sulfuriflexus mobilis TaxID=1811807 RepID=UPI000F843630|nr:nucleotide 5'-monophosphate nucleosidase PpnN [Sulfuriflexus mobilis]
MKYDVIDARISPVGRLALLSKSEVAKLLDTSKGGLYRLLRNCSLAALNSGSTLDDGKELLERYQSFEIRVIQQERGIKLEVLNAPAHAFVDGKMIKGINEHLFAVLRDVIFVSDEIIANPIFDLEISDGITNAIFHILRNANIMQPKGDPKLVVCWGGHAIKRREYDYSKEVGYQVGLRGLDICTGCGPGAMKGPMKGATIGHAKQRINNGQYLGVTEPGIIAAESPNPIVNDLVIMPDIEKRLEAFIRIGHGIIVFPGGVGTAEEILYILGVLLHPENKHIPFPLIFTGPKSAKEYFEEIDRFILATLGEQAKKRYTIIIEDPQRVAKEIARGITQVREFRKQHKDAYYFNWLLKIDDEFQRPFNPTHENMRNLVLHADQDKHLLAANLRRVFSGVVAGNVKDEGMRAIEKYGHFEIQGDAKIMAHMDSLLTSFVEQNRMKLDGKKYKPCYKIVK